MQMCLCLFVIMLTIQHIAFIIRKVARKKQIWDINGTRRALGLRICALLPFVHAFSGCDTTSRIYGVGKGIVLKDAMSDQSFRDK